MIGTQIGRYRITEELGRGGMGVVYRATQVTLNRTVAVKLLFPHLATSAEYLTRFRREAETLARLDHENIVRIFDIEDYEDTHCIVMEYVGGPSLSRILAREGRLPPRRARDIAADVASALAAAHRQGVIHRDIKPDNILFSTNGRPKLTDFGIARIADSGQATRTGIMMGTPSYMSPEQAAGRPVTAASDLYSLGIVLFEMLAGRVPFQGCDALAVALKHLNESPPLLRSVAPDPPEDLCAMVARALAKAPEERFASALELRESLLGLDLAGDPGHPPADAPEPTFACPECGHGLRAEFLTCPKCGLAIRQRCARCEHLFDPLSTECPFCRTPATPVPGLPSPLPGPETVQAGTVAVRSGTGSSPAVTERARPPRRPHVSTRIGIGSLVVVLGLVATVLLLPGGRPSAASERPPEQPPGGGAAAGPAGLQSLIRPRSETAPLTAEDMEAISRAAGDTLAPATVPPTPRSRDGPAAPAPAPATEPAARPSEPEPASPGAEPAGEPERADSAVVADAARAEEASARAAIRGIVERQRRGTEAGDLVLLLEDVAPELHDGVRASFRDMQASAREVRSEVGVVTIDFTARGAATVAFHARLTGRRVRDGRAVTIHDGPVTWDLERRAGRWLITGL
jgi:eukaryotic-like serine/threonine-protein kinase